MTYKSTAITVYQARNRKLVEVEIYQAHNEAYSIIGAKVRERGGFSPQRGIPCTPGCLKPVAQFFKVEHQHLDVAHFQIKVNHQSKLVRFGPEGALGMVPSLLQGGGIGRFCMAKVIGIAQDLFPGYSVAPGSLSPKDAETDQEKNNRNNFYRKLGFNLEFEDADQRGGQFVCNSLDELSTSWNKSKVRELSPLVWSKILDRASYYRKLAISNQNLASARVIAEDKMAKTAAKYFSLSVVLGILLLITNWHHISS